MAVLIELSHESFLRMRAGAEVIEADKFGEKLIRLRDEGTYFKLFRRKRLISSAAWYPYAQRFADNALALAAQDVRCPKVIEVYWLPFIKRHGVHYWPLEGTTLRQIIQAGKTEDALRLEFGAFVAKLHRLGVYFRSLHLGNVIRTPDGEFGLIDIADLVILRRALGKHLLARNLRHLSRYATDREWLMADEGREFISGYTACSHLVPVLPQ